MSALKAWIVRNLWLLSLAAWTLAAVAALGWSLDDQAWMSTAQDQVTVWIDCNYKCSDGPAFHAFLRQQFAGDWPSVLAAAQADGLSNFTSDVQSVLEARQAFDRDTVEPTIALVYGVGLAGLAVARLQLRK